MQKISQSKSQTTINQVAFIKSQEQPQNDIGEEQLHTQESEPHKDVCFSNAILDSGKTLDINHYFGKENEKKEIPIIHLRKTETEFQRFNPVVNNDNNYTQAKMMVQNHSRRTSSMGVCADPSMELYLAKQEICKLKQDNLQLRSIITGNESEMKDMQLEIKFLLK